MVEPGYLIKLGFKSGKWQNRYFQVKDGNLVYSEDATSGVKGTIALASITGASTVPPGSKVTSDACKTTPKKPVAPFAFKITTNENRSFYCLASSNAEAERWVAALKPQGDASATSAAPVEVPGNSCPYSTSLQGAPIADGQFALRAGQRGPLLLQDWQLLEKHAHFNRERIPERIVHAKGSGAFGTLTITQDISRYTKAKFLQQGKTTEMLIRFSTVAGELGAADAERDVRGVAMKFYTEEGNYDMVGNNTPVFFLRDPALFPDFVHTQKRDTRTNMRDGNAAWKYWSEHPESLHQVTILMSDRGIPTGYRFMNAYSSHTYSFINANNERFYFKWHFKTNQGHKHYTNAEAATVVGKDRESSQADLYNAIERGEFPSWKACVQVMPEADVADRAYDPFDLTKVWPHTEYPLIEVGTLELNRNPENYFAEIEQAAFAPKNVVPGIGHSPDPVLQMRIFSYMDAQNYRLGSNHHFFPVNRARCPIHAPELRAGVGNLGDNTDANYQAPKDPSIMREPPLNITGPADRYQPEATPVTDYTQPGNLFRIFTPDQKQRLFSNIADAMQGVDRDIIEAQLAHFKQADPEYEAGVRKALGM